MIKLLARSRKQRVHFLHIGKTGGSAIKSALRDYLETPRYSLILHGHGTSLKDVRKGEHVVFFLRDPIARFVSGFYSRQRKGQPRYYAEWRPQEKEVFENFATPNQVAVSLGDRGSREHAVAVMALKSVPHFKPYSKWYVSLEYFQSRIDDILFIGFQESLDRDFEELKGILGIPPSVSLPADDIAAHRSPRTLDTFIEERGMSALRNWFADDFEFIVLCKTVMAGRKNVHGR